MWLELSTEAGVVQEGRRGAVTPVAGPHTLGLEDRGGSWTFLR